jgi:uncharacterized membrane protein YeiH
MNVPQLIHLNISATFEIFDLIAVFLFATGGALAAIRKRYDFIGVLMLAFFSGIGGGLIRDAVFIQNGPPLAVLDGSYLIFVLAAFALSMIFHGTLIRMKKTTMIVDALGLGTYGVVGAHAALRADLVPLAAVMVGVFNAVGAGLIRDVLIREEPIIFKPGQFYAGAAIAGSVLFVFLVVVVELDDVYAATISIALAFLLRLSSVYFNWQTRPIVRDEAD